MSERDKPQGAWKPYFEAFTQWKIWEFGVAVVLGDTGDWALEAYLGPFLVRYGFQRVALPFDRKELEDAIKVAAKFGVEEHRGLPTYLVPKDVHFLDEG